MSIPDPHRDFAAEEAAERAAPATFRHARRGGVYTVIGNATLQADVPLTDDAALVVYRAEDGRLWARPPAEFHDGRFVPVAQGTAGDIPLPLRGPRTSERDARISELLDANSREVERRRAAEAEARHLRECLLARLGEPAGELAVAQWLRQRGFVVNRLTQDERASRIQFQNKETNQ